MRGALFLVLAVLSLIVTGPARAQDMPRVTVELETAETIPGQPLDLRITVLVPTWLPKPVVFPTFEAPNLMVRLPERATNPISERIDRDTWSGVSRRYRITPLVPGRFVIPPQELIVTWADPDSSAPREEVVPIEAITITGILPDGAEGLNPFLAARAVTLTQEVTGATAPLGPGDSVIREVTAEIEGGPAMLLPGLLAVEPVTGLTVYPSEPVLSETETRGAPGGSRVERVTYLAQSGGNGAAPPVTLDWYNLDTGQVETASVPGVDLTVDAPVARSVPALSPQRLILGALMLVLVLGVVAFSIRPALRRWKRWRAARLSRYLASPAHARSLAIDAARRRDLSATLAALDLWAARLGAPDPRRDPAIASALSDVGAALYGPSPNGDLADWPALDRALAVYSPDRASHHHLTGLPPLNPR